MTGSHAFWEQRYRAGGDSGAGSRGDAAKVKAACINQVIGRRDVASVVDWGCGDGQQMALYDLAGVAYVGVEVSPTALTRCLARRPEQAYVLWRPGCGISLHADLAMSIDLLHHFPDDDDYSEHLEQLFASANRYVLIHSTDRDELPSAVHVRHRPVGVDVAARFADWTLTDVASGGVAGCEFKLYARAVGAHDG